MNLHTAGSSTFQPSPHRIEKTMRRIISRAVTILVTITGIGVAPHAGADPVRDRNVTYIVTANREATINIFYGTQDGPTQQLAILSMLLSKASIDPNTVWTQGVTLKYPKQWAYLSVSSGGKINPGLGCKIVVDSKTVVEEHGGAGVLCSLREW